ARGEGGAGPHRCDGRRGHGRRIRLPQGAARRGENAARGGDRARRANRGRRQPLRRERAPPPRRPPPCDPYPPRGGGELAGEAAEVEQVERLQAWRAARDGKAVAAALKDLRAAAQSGRNIMPVSIACAKAGVTTGEWGAALREAWGEYRAPTGVGRAVRNESA